ncbi:hypothetical protein PFICI_07798 [Pestalotiopsis fici W106-1]|uniref:DUF6546 domain-containing protein n=1 Tax=Pestalotiopsis fici (strain W106-1 / CGMCC3.15140) TaxID=1229662 RepID=W3X2N5_PESFW|nr:uncharacterized protein PFICI_07798 [Pestalotiopsis fici W106-1]ETS80269.1 hypothetical protein PFICI_07798 [Pestalotiopsis fici W106-1]
MTSIHSLPVEILLPIIQMAIEPGSEAAVVCATVSRRWQPHVERQTFASLRLDTDRLSKAKDILTPARQTYVRHICMEALLPEYDEPELRGRRETDEEQQQNNQAFTRAIVGLFDCLSLWEPIVTGTGRPGVILQLCASSPSDRYGSGGRREDRIERWKYSDLSLESGVEDDLPALGMITQFKEHFSCGYKRSILHKNRNIPRYIAASVYGIIASKLTNLEAVHWRIMYIQEEYIPLRQKMRQDFAASLASFPQSVHHFSLFYPWAELMGHDIQPPRAHVDDPLSIALRGIAQHCTTFKLEGTVVFDTNLFWPQQLPLSLDETPYWPRLEEVRISSSKISPLGAWLFHKHPSAPRPRPRPPSPPHVANSPEVLTVDDPSYHFRVLLDHEYFGEICLAAARAATRMPRLKDMTVAWEMMMSCSFGYNVRYSVSDGRACAEYWSDSTPALPLTAEAEEAWRAAARVHMGEGGQISFDPANVGERAPWHY